MSRVIDQRQPKESGKGQEQIELAVRDLMRIPGVGKSIARDLVDLGFRSVQELKGQEPEEMYARSCHLAGQRIDRCLLYVYRCAVYFAEAKKPDPERLKWWNWKD